MEKKFYEQGYGARPVPVVKRSHKSETEENQFVKFDPAELSAKKKNGFKVKVVGDSKTIKHKYECE